ncbi:MAG: Hsp20/alpha crystallin family protein [Salinisphaera sp.]|uniref:Hsp20/alpha crystallin family protein n=1 Tax=Salinisphaera sp. TaxID=1914330 RepID=UPI003C7CA00D
MDRTTRDLEHGLEAGSEREFVSDDRDDWMLAVDIREFDEYYLIRIELPGVMAEDIALAVEDGVLLLTGERPRLWHGGNRRRHRCPYCHRHFARSVSLPSDALCERFDVTRQDGAVEIRFLRNAAAAVEAKQTPITTL